MEENNKNEESEFVVKSKHRASSEEKKDSRIEKLKQPVEIDVTSRVPINPCAKKSHAPVSFYSLPLFLLIILLIGYLLYRLLF